MSASDSDTPPGPGPEGDHAPHEGHVQVPEVKTLTFTTLRDVLPVRLGEDTYRQLRHSLDPPTRALLDSAEPGDWAPEVQMQQVMDAIYGEVLNGDDEAYVELVRAVAMAGISRFMRIFLSLASERFVLSKIPVVWRRLRRHAGTVTTSTEGDLVVIDYEDFPFFGDKAYRLLSLANCQALACAASERIPDGRIVSWSSDALQLEFSIQR